MSRIVSFVVLVAILIGIAFLFFRVMAGFVLPLFLAVLLVVMFRPLHHWFVAKCDKHDHLAAALTTASILLIFLIPLLTIFLMAASEGVAIYQELDVKQIDPQFLANQVERLNDNFGWNLSSEEVQGEIVKRVQEWLAPLILSTTKYALSLVVGLCILVLALYYFFLDGPRMVSTIMRLSPLDDRYETELIREFDTISRAVVLASVISAL
ncbi:MAG: AI-2E family transporter, partial [Pirellulales bacterium]|nr:AI-2E family transporter [Pirellulales bacterium]